MSVIMIDASDLIRKCENVDQYNQGFMAGVHQGLPRLLAKIGATVVDAIGIFIDRMAAGNPAALHHIYEWGSVGGARLFNFSYAVGGSSVTFTGQTTQSGSIAPTADRPFYNKADVMETGQSVTIEPYGEALVFNDIFVRRPVFVANPGGGGTVGQFQRVTDQFFTEYVTQAFLAPILQALETPTAWEASFAAGANGGGYGAGVSAGIKYIAGAPVGSIAV